MKIIKTICIGVTAALSSLPTFAQQTYEELEQLTVNEQVTTVITASEPIRFVDISTDKVVGDQPSLIALPYLGDVKVNDPIYQNTRKFVWSEDNPYFFKGTAGEGIGGPHIGYDMIWPMSIMMKAFTSQNDAEIKTCIKMLMDTDAGTGFMHESFHKNNPKNFTRSWFAWQNTLFGELILKLVNEGKVDLLNSIQ